MNKTRTSRRRTVPTGVYGDAAMEILAGVRDVVSRYGSKYDCHSFAAMEFERDVDGEIVMAAYDDDWHHPVYKTVFRDGRKDDAGVREWLAGVVKGAFKLRSARYFYDVHRAEISKLAEWSRECAAEVELSQRPGKTFSMAMGYALYDVLKGRRLKAGKYLPGALAAVVGEKFDPVRTELENLRREEAKRLAAEYKASYDEIEKWYSAEMNKLYEEAGRRRQAAKEKFDAESGRVNEEIDRALAEAFPAAAAPGEAA